MKLNKRESEYRATLRRVFEAPDGQILLKYWQEDILLAPIYEKGLTELDMAYKLGQRETIQMLLGQVTDINKIQNIKLATEGYQ